jgi:hypothetical protein
MMITVNKYKLMKLKYCIDRLDGKISEVKRHMFAEINSV